MLRKVALQICCDTQVLVDIRQSSVEMSSCVSLGCVYIYICIDIILCIDCNRNIWQDGIKP